MNFPRFRKSPSASFKLFFAFTAVSASLSAACSGDLEDDEMYIETVKPGVGAGGVENCEYIENCNNTGVSPSVSPSVNPTTTGPGPTPTVPGSVEPSPSGSVSPDTTVAPPVAPATPILSAECADVPTRILESKCGISGCHGAGGTYTDLASDLDNLPARLKDAPTVATNCDEAPLLIDSSNYQNSTLLNVVSENHCTSLRMPVPPPLPDDELRCLTEWVQAVAAGEL